MCVCNGDDGGKKYVGKTDNHSSTKVLVKEDEDLHPPHIHTVLSTWPFLLCDHQEAHLE